MRCACVIAEGGAGNFAPLTASRAASSNAALPLDSVTQGVGGGNLMNDDIRNHVSFKKDEVLLPGRNVRFIARLKY